MALVALGLLATACGVPTSNEADVIPARDVPFGLLSPTVPSTTTTTTTPAPTVTETVFMVRASDAVTPVRRQVAVPAGLDEVLQALLSGPTTAETAAGLSTALPPTVRVVSTVVLGPTATLVMNPAFTAISGPAQVLAVAQLVLTATRQPGVQSVQFMVANAVVPVPTASGASTTAPVTAAQYASLLGQ